MLVDTQVVLWFLSNNPKLGSKAKDLILKTPQVYVSSVSILEIVIKSMMGKLKAPDNFFENIESNGFNVLSMDGAHANAVKNYAELAHHDPFDRVLLAQASCEQMLLLTADTALLGLESSLMVDATI